MNSYVYNFFPHFYKMLSIVFFFLGFCWKTSSHPKVSVLDIGLTCIKWSLWVSRVGNSSNSLVYLASTWKQDKGEAGLDLVLLSKWQYVSVVLNCGNKGILGQRALGYFPGESRRVKGAQCVPAVCDSLDCSPQAPLYGILSPEILEWGCHFLLQEIFNFKEIKLYLCWSLHWQMASLPLSASWETPYSSAVKNPPVNAEGCGFNPSQGTKIPHLAWKL